MLKILNLRSQMSSTLLQIAGWSILPDLATRRSLSFIHDTVFKYFHRPPPPPGSPAYVQHYRYTYATVVLGYLLYNLIEASTRLPKNFYELLDVRPAVADANALKTAFRAFARKHHPDRVGPQGEAHFVEVRDAFEALKDPIVKFAYDRFGPDVLRWKECSTMKEYLRRGLLNSSAYHVVTGAGLVLFSVIGRPSPIATWRYLLFIVMFALEFYLLLTSPSQSAEPSLFVDDMSVIGTIPDRLFPNRVVYQHVSLLHQIFLFLSIALSRVAPVLFPSLVGSDPAAKQQMVKAMAERVEMLAKSTERELSIMQNIALHAIHDSHPSEDGVPTNITELPKKLDEDVMRVLSTAMEDILIEGKLKSEAGPMRSAWERAVQKHKERGADKIDSFGDVSERTSKQDQELPSIKKRHTRARSVSL
ncbi:hypothetical protein ID866_3260 [Astraeus odoratus]|nr:hypothetical protein ID866_3260 [Astraeus odoratus]